MAKYQGHRSWNAWNVSLWLSNDYNLYCLVNEVIREQGTKDKAARHLLELLPPETPDGGKFNYTCVREALQHWSD